MSTWSYNTPVDSPGSVISGSGMVRWNNTLDAVRSGQSNRIPSAEYPDGYLGNIQGRHQDRLLSKMQNRLTDRSYQRGVHKGERIDPQDYMWPGNFNPNTRLQQQARSSARWAPTGNPVEILVNGGKLGPQDQDRMQAKYGIGSPAPIAEINPERNAHLQQLLPRYR